MDSLGTCNLSSALQKFISKLWRENREQWLGRIMSIKKIPEIFLSLIKCRSSTCVYITKIDLEVH